MTFYPLFLLKLVLVIESWLYQLVLELCWLFCKIEMILLMQHHSVYHFLRLQKQSRKKCDCLHWLVVGMESVVNLMLITFMLSSLFFLLSILLLLCLAVLLLLLNLFAAESVRDTADICVWFKDVQLSPLLVMFPAVNAPTLFLFVLVFFGDEIDDESFLNASLAKPSFSNEQHLFLSWVFH